VLPESYRVPSLVIVVTWRSRHRACEYDCVTNPRTDREGACVDASPPAWPSPFTWRVGIHDFPFEACSGFTRVYGPTDCSTAQGGLCHEASTSQLPAKPLVSYQTDRLLPGWILPPLVIRALGAHDSRCKCPGQTEADEAVHSVALAALGRAEVPRFADPGTAAIDATAIATGCCPR
jgi:hypothetical protein